MKRDEEELHQIRVQNMRAPRARGLPVGAAPLRSWTTAQFLQLSLVSKAQKDKKEPISPHHQFNFF